MNDVRFRRSLLNFGPVAAYAALIFFVSSMTKFPDTTPYFFGADKLAHFAEYFLFGLLIRRWLDSLARPSFKRHAFWLTTAFGLLYAVSDEWHQSFVPGRDASLWDVFFDGSGIMTAARAYPFLKGKARALNQEVNNPATEVRHEQKTCRHD